MNTIYILWLRQIKRYFRSKARMIGSLGQPLLFLLALGFGFGPIYQKAGQGSYLQFIGPGVIAMAIIFTAIFMGIEIIWDRQFGFLKETLVAPASRFEIMIGRTLGGATVATIQGIFVFLLTLVVGFRPVSLALLPLALVFMILISLVFTALGTAIATQLQDMQAFPIIMNFLIMPIFFLSGAIFPLESFPQPIVTAMSINPLVYGVDGLRGALIQGAHLGLLNDFFILSLITLVLLGIGSYLFSKIQV
ncbi:MAG: ABC transporter permease [Candidatus Buchananbacteria bacterium]